MANTDPILTAEGAVGRGFWNKGSQQIDGALVLPTVDTVFTNPDLRTSGKLRYNTTSNLVEVFNGTEWTSLSQDIQTVDDITELEAFSANDETIIVKDSLRGGIFVYVPTGLTVDNGIVFNATGKGSGYWQRQYDTGTGVNILWYGIDNTGVADCSTALWAILRAQKTVIVPEGIYNVLTMIGNIDVDDPLPDAQPITHDLEIIGFGNPVFECNAVVGLRSMFGFTVSDGADVTFRGITIDANNHSFRGIYIKRPEGTGVATVQGCTIKNMYNETETAFSAAGVIFLGGFEFVNFSSNIISDIHAATGTLTPGSNSISGFIATTLSGLFIKKLIFQNNIVENIFSDDDTYAVDQIGITYNAGSNDPYLETYSNITGNTFKNCRTRFVKIQSHNQVVNNNLFITESDFVIPVGTSEAVDVQYGDAVINDNTFIYNTYSHSRCITLADRDETFSTKVAIQNNKILIHGASTQMLALIFYNNTILNGETGSILVTDNYITTAAAEYLFQCRISSADNNATISNNVIEGITISLANTLNASGTGTSTKFIKYYLENNINKSTAIPLLTKQAAVYVTHAYSGIHNIGFTEPNTYIEQTEIEALIDADLALKANIASPTFTGTVTITSGGFSLSGGSSATVLLGTGAASNGNTFVQTRTIGTITPNNSAIADADTFKVAVEKAQGQINAKAPTDNPTFTTNVTSPKFTLSALNTAPSSASDTGTTGEIRIDADYIFICVATNTWKRVAISTW